MAVEDELFEDWNQDVHWKGSFAYLKKHRDNVQYWKNDNLANSTEQLEPSPDDYNLDARTAVNDESLDISDQVCETSEEPVL